MRAGQPGPQSAKTAGPTAKLRALGPRARSKSRPDYSIGGDMERQVKEVF